MLPVTSKKISVKTILITDGVALPTISSITVGMTTDIVPPVVNASNILMKKSTSGANIGV
jgi:hypothetical protein